LLSVHNQTVKPAEILLVDDHSSAENRAKLLELSNLATILTTPTNLGPSRARNLGAEKAQGEWIAFLDDDDCFLPDKLERQIAYLEAHPSVQALGGGLTMVTPEGKEEYWGKKPTRRLTLAHALCYTASMSQALMIRRDVFLEIGGFDPDFVHLEDREFGIRLLASGYETHFLAEALFLYHHGGGRQQLSAEWRKMLGAELKIIRVHANLARQEFGRFGPLRMEAQVYEEQGLRRGGLEGRAAWAWGRLLHACSEMLEKFSTAWQPT
jgi:GT2 family glycosyltransferase